MQADAPGPLPEQVRIWDLPVRLAHWLLVVAIAGSWLTHQGGTAWFWLHRYCGYTVPVLVAFRLLWGAVGTRPARFRAFVRGPRAVVAYLRSGWRSASPGHNPLGGWSVLLMLALLGLQAVTGLFANDEVASAGPLYGWVDHATSNRLTDLHHASFDWLLAAIALHLVAVAFYELVLGRRLIAAMLTGQSRAELPAAVGIDRSLTLRATALVVALALALAGLLRLAPESAVALF
jgi:cytochrome b